MAADDSVVTEEAAPSKTETELRRWIGEQGYGLEHRTATAFRALKYRVRQSVIYRTDSDFGEIDVVAEAMLTGLYRFVVVVECKRSKEPWVVRKSALATEEFSWSPIASPDLAKHLREYWSVLVQPALPVEQPVAFDVVQAHKKAGTENPAYQALRQSVASAAALQATSAYPAPVMYHAVLITDAPLYNLTYSAAGDEELRPTKRERVVIGSAPAWPSIVAVDLVSVDDLAALPQSLRNAFQDINDRLPNSPAIGS